jgi:hypothetical protein
MIFLTMPTGQEEIVGNMTREERRVFFLFFFCFLLVCRMRQANIGTVCVCANKGDAAQMALRWLS